MEQSKNSNIKNTSREVNDEQIKKVMAGIRPSPENIAFARQAAQDTVKSLRSLKASE